MGKRVILKIRNQDGHEDDNDDENEDGREDDVEDEDEAADRPWEIIPAANIPPIPLLGQLVVCHCLRWHRATCSEGVYDENRIFIEQKLNVVFGLTWRLQGSDSCAQCSRDEEQEVGSRRVAVQVFAV